MLVFPKFATTDDEDQKREFVILFEKIKADWSCSNGCGESTPCGVILLGLLLVVGVEVDLMEKNPTV
jgi:hypothetical protein